MAPYLVIDLDRFGYTMSKEFQDELTARGYAQTMAESRFLVKVELYQYNDVLGYLMLKRYDCEVSR
jgi:hypothetical protein